MREKILSKHTLCLSVQAKLIALLFGIAAAVALPQLAHAAGSALGVGTGLGELLLPMHLPILLLGFVAGPVAGAFAGVAAPLVSFLLSGMPLVTALPFMCVELCVYGLSAGLLRHVKMPVLLQLMGAQVLGRGARTLAILMAREMGKTALTVGSTWAAVPRGLAGLALQWLLIPVCLILLERLQKHEK